jgi:hypothetical protein
MVVAYGMFDGWPSACEWMVPNSDKEEQIAACLATADPFDNHCPESA